MSWQFCDAGRSGTLSRPVAQQFDSDPSPEPLLQVRCDHLTHSSPDIAHRQQPRLLPNPAHAARRSSRFLRIPPDIQYLPLPTSHISAPIHLVSNSHITFRASLRLSLYSDSPAPTSMTMLSLSTVRVLYLMENSWTLPDHDLRPHISPSLPSQTVKIASWLFDRP